MSPYVAIRVVRVVKKVRLARLDEAVRAGQGRRGRGRGRRRRNQHGGVLMSRERHFRNVTSRGEREA